MSQPVTFPHGGTDEDTDAEALSRIWRRLARPFDTAATVEAVLGLSQTVVRQYIGTLAATSEDAMTLLDSMPRAVRSLATNMDSHAIRCPGELRGPILWSETMAARAASNGQEDLFVCAVPGRAYDITENQVLVSALLEITASSADAQLISEDAYDDDMLRLARQAGDRAHRFLQHPSLRNVSRVRPSGRDLKRTRSGKRRHTYRPALQVLQRREEPLSPELLNSLTDQRTRAQHEVLMALVDLAEAQTGRLLPEFRAEHGVLYSGPIQYFHPQKRASRDNRSGILLGSLLIDVPDRVRETNRLRAEDELALRAGRSSFVVMNRDDISRAYEVAVNLAQL